MDRLLLLLAHWCISHLRYLAPSRQLANSGHAPMSQQPLQADGPDRLDSLERGDGPPPDAASPPAGGADANQAGAATRESEPSFRELARQAPVGIFQTDANGNCLFVNERWCEIAGLTPEEAQGQGWLRALHPEDQERLALEWYDAARFGQEFCSEYRFRTPEGKVTWLSGSAVALRDDAGAISGYVGTITDISRLRRAEESIRLSEARYHGLFETSLDGIMIVDEEGRYVDVNDSMCRILRAPRSELVGAHFSRFMPPDRLETAQEAFRQLKSTGSFSAEFPVRAADGTIVELEWTSRGHFVPGLHVCVARDITERKRAERRLAAEHTVTRVLTEARTLEEAAPAIIQVLCESIGGQVGELWCVDEAGGRLWCAAIWSSDRSGALEPFEAMSREIRFRLGEGLPGRVWASGETTAIRELAIDPNFPRAGVAMAAGLRSGLAFPLAVGGAFYGVIEFFTQEPFEPDEPLRRMMTAIGQDIAQFVRRRQAEVEVQRLNQDLAQRIVELRESEQRFRQLADAMPQIVWSARPDGYLDYYNRRWYEFTGFAEGEGGDESWKPILHPDDVPLCVERWYEAVRSGQAYEVEYRFWDRQRGAYRWHLGRALPARDSAGSIVRWFGTCTDIDDQKRAMEQLAEADRRKDEFLAMLAHELRNPLAPILNAVHVAQRSGLAAPLLQRQLEVIARQAGHMARLLDDLLDVARITQGKIGLRKEPSDLASIVTQAVDACRPLIDSRGQQLAISLPDRSVPVNADATRMEQVIANLLNNAAKYTDPGGQLHLSAEQDGEQAVIRVRDSGIGIPARMLPHIFDLFIQAESTLDRSQGGLGIGLTLVRSLVELHDGTVAAFSEGPGRGSEFVVTLPALQATVEQTPDARRQTPVGDPRLSLTSGLLASGAWRLAPAKRILVVDDNRDAAETLTEVLELWGHEVRIALHGREAILLARQFQPEVVLLDIGLPDLDGYEVAGRLRQQEEGERVLLIAVSGYGQEEDRQQAREAGFDLHLTKPVDLTALQRLLAGPADRS